MFQIIAESISKRYAGKYVFRDISLEARAPEVVCLVGPNGSGKTTLLKILCGLMRPTRGQVTVTRDNSDYPPARLRTTFGIQTPHVVLYDELTVRENLEFVLTLRGGTYKNSQADALLERLSLTHKRDTAVAALSSGMKQKLTLIAAAAHTPEALFLDEPTSYVDRNGKENVRALIEEWRARALIIIATNDPQEQEWGDRVIELGH